MFISINYGLNVNWWQLISSAYMFDTPEIAGAFAFISFKKEKNFSVGDLVWAKMRGHPHWPAEVVCLEIVCVLQGFFWLGEIKNEMFSTFSV